MFGWNGLARDWIGYRIFVGVSWVRHLVLLEIWLCSTFNWDEDLVGM